ncbi:MAG: hypothetical protein HY000_28275 [Planctomycetes bacterium]|nr:hypothetical protein [Planctomycetota bacterium]
MILVTHQEERAVIQVLDGLVRQVSVRTIIDPIVLQVEQKLAQDTGALLAWQPVPLTAYGETLPEPIRSSWVFVLRAGTTSGAERHPNSHQRVMSYRGYGDLQVWGNERWQSNHLVSEQREPLEKRWLSIPVNVWHQAVVPDQNWVVVSFHTVPADELIEERPDPSDAQVTRQKRYLGQ